MAVVELKKQERNIEIKVRKNLHNELTKKRYFVAELVKKALDKYLDYDDMSADNSLSIYTLPMINEELNIIDFKIRSLSVHVVATIDKAKNQNVYIPQIYKQTHYKPDMILFVNFTKTFTKMEMLGFITNIDFNNMAISKDTLTSADSLTDVLKELKSKEQDFSSNAAETTKELILAYIDNDLSDEGKRFFIKNIIKNSEVRKNYKMFYALNCDFVSVANSSTIQKLNPEEEEKKIHLQSRSDYLIDKAISKYEDENQNDDENFTDEETENSLIANFNSESNLTDDNNANDENILEFSLENLTTEPEPDITEDETAEEVNIEQEPEQVEQIQDFEENNPEQFDEPDDKSIAVENVDMEFESLESANQEFSLDNDDEIFDLSQNESDDDLSLITQDEYDNSENEGSINEYAETDNLIEEDNNIQNNDVELESEAMEILNNSEDDDLSDIAVDDDELTKILNSEDNVQTEYENKIATDMQTDNQEQEIVPEIEEITASSNEEDDLFEFLSEIAEQGENNVQENQEIVVPELNQQEQQSNEQDEYNQVSNTAFEQNTVQEQNIELETNINVQQYANQQPQRKSSAMPILGGLLALTVAIGISMNMDTIKSKLHVGNTNEEIEGLALDGKDALPPPVSDATTEANNDASTTADTQEATAPVPTQIAANTTGDAAIPSAQDAPTLPNLPSTTVEPPKAKHMNDAIATALTKDFNSVRISKVSWEASETLVNNPEVKRYLTIAGKSIKNTLSQDLMAATEPSFKDTVVVGITYRKDGSVSKINIDGSSGSAQIDGIVKKSVDNTLKYVKMPALNLSTPEYTTKLIIRL